MEVETSNYTLNQTIKHIFTKDSNDDTIQGNYIPLTRINQFFFGTNDFVHEFNLFEVLFNRNVNIVNKYGINYLSATNLPEYLEQVTQILDLENKFNCCPYNYYKFVGDFIPTHYRLMIKSIDRFLKYLENKDTPDSKTIRHMMSPGILKGKVKELEPNVDIVTKFEKVRDNVINLKFSKKGFTLKIRMKLSFAPEEGLLRMSEDVEDEELESLYQYLCNKLRMDSPEEFMINNLERVCGSYEFAEIMVKSYLKKSDYVYDVDDISAIIMWKDEESESRYKEYFYQKYESCIKKINDKVKLNFEGINKFLLNITESDVENFEVKEQINEMYYSSMHELIYSFEKLYQNRTN
jgi:hypothetical protein